MPDPHEPRYLPSRMFSETLQIVMDISKNVAVQFDKLITKISLIILNILFIFNHDWIRAICALYKANKDGSRQSN